MAYRIFGWACVVACLPMAAYGVYEQTVLTWRQGPQMLGFTLSHEHVGLLILGLFATICLYGWVAAFILQIFLKRARVQGGAGLADWAQFAIAVIALAVFLIPYGGWQWAAIEFAGPGPHAADQLVLAASKGQKHVVSALLEHGVKADARNSDAKTALDSACGAGREEIADWLVAHGADVNAAPQCRKFAKFASRMKLEIPAAGSESSSPMPAGESVPAAAAQ